MRTGYEAGNEEHGSMPPSSSWGEERKRRDNTDKPTRVGIPL